MLDQSHKQPLIDQLVEFVYHSQKIEGCQLTLNETIDICKYNDFPELLFSQRSIYNDTIETLSMYNLFLHIFNDRIYTEIAEPNIIRWHYYMFNNTKPNIGGQLRGYNVYISGSKTRFPDYTEVKKLFSRLEGWFNNKVIKRDYYPVEFAFQVHYRLVKLHPFGDGNGRISRFVMNYILNDGNKPLMIIKHEDRWDYYKVLGLGNEQKFVDWCNKYYINKCFSASL